MEFEMTAEVPTLPDSGERTHRSAFRLSSEYRHISWQGRSDQKALHIPEEETQP